MYFIGDSRAERFCKLGNIPLKMINLLHPFSWMRHHKTAEGQHQALGRIIVSRDVFEGPTNSEKKVL